MDSTHLPYKVVLVDYDDDLFTPPGWMGDELADVGAAWVVAQVKEVGRALDLARDADVVMIQSVAPVVTGVFIAGLERCRCVIRLGIGFDSVDVKSATGKGILVCNVPTYCVDDVAEHALALLLDGVRHLAKQDRWIRAGRWDRRGAHPARRIKGSTLGLVAFGRIARALAERAKGLGVDILAFDPFVESDTMQEYGVEKVSLEQLLQRCDFISVHAPLNEHTRHLLSWSQFELMKPGAVLVNTSRGPVIDGDALADALESGKVWGAGLDVMEVEPLPADSPLREQENITFTPHVGANSEQSRIDLYRSALDTACDVLSGRWPPTVVNPEVTPWFPIVGQDGD